MSFQKTHGKFLLKISNKTSLQKRTHASKTVNFTWIASVKIRANRNCAARPCTSTSEMCGIRLATIKWNKGKRGKLRFKSLSGFSKKISKSKLQSLHVVPELFFLQPVLFQRVSLTSSKVIEATQSYSAAFLTHFKKYFLNLSPIQN